MVSDQWLAVIRNFFRADQAKLTTLTGPVYLREFLPLKLGVHQGLTKKALGHETLVGSNEALTKNLWEKIQPHLSNDDKQYAEDMEMAGVIVQQGGEVAFDPDMIVFTSARWMIRYPFRSSRSWRRKMRNTKRLLGLTR